MHLKKILIFIILICCIALTSCKKKEAITNPVNEEMNISKPDLLAIPEIIANRLLSMNSYEMHTTGTTVAKVVVNYTQTIDSLLAKLDDTYYLKTISNSLLVKVYHEAYFTKTEVKYRTKSNEDFMIKPYYDYVESYGNHPFSLNLEGFLLSDAIISVIKIEDTDLAYKIVIDGNQGGLYNKIKMKAYGNLSGYPDFQSIEMIVHVNDDLTPTRISFSGIYDAPYPLLGKARCTQNYDVEILPLSYNIKEIIEKQ